MAKKTSEDNLAAQAAGLDGPAPLSHATREDVALVAFFTPNYIDVFTGDVNWGLPYVELGPPGVGKTFQNYQLASRLVGDDGNPLTKSKHFVTWKPGARGDGAFGVVPTPVTHTRRDGSTVTALDFPPPIELLRMLDSAPNPVGMIFLDELTTASELIKPAMLAILQEGEFGSFRAPGRCRINAGANPPDMGTSAKPFTPPEANRMAHFRSPAPDTTAWAEYMLSGGAGRSSVDAADLIEVKSLEDHILKNWNLEYARTLGLVIGFSKRGLLNMPDADSDEVQGPWKSPRTMEMMTRALTTARIMGRSEQIQNLFVHALIGGRAHSEWITYASATKIPDPIDVLDGKANIPASTELSYATFSSVDAYLRGLGTITSEQHRSTMAPEQVREAERRWKQFGQVTGAALQQDHLKSTATATVTSMQQARVLPLHLMSKEVTGPITVAIQKGRQVAERFRFTNKS
jgi:hypothetical protein